MGTERIRFSDASWLFMESRERPMHVATLLILSLPPQAPRDYLRQVVAALRGSTEFVAPFNLRVADPPLRKLLPMWVQDFDPDLEYHVRHSALPYPGGERELGALISRLHSNPLDFNRPLWEYHVIEGLENARFAIYFKMHHSIVDGIAGVRMLQRSMSASAGDTDTPALWSAGSDTDARAGAAPAPGFAAAAAQTVGSAVQIARGIARMVRAARDPRDPIALPFQTPVSILNHRIRSQRRFATQIYEFARIRRLAKAGECTVNDIVLALCSGALRRFLKDLGALPGRSLTAGIPVSMRAADDQGAGTAVSFIIASLATDIADPRRRLASIATSTRRAKAVLGNMPRAAIEGVSSAMMTPYALQIAAGLEGRTRPVFNVAISNVPGPVEPLFFRGARLEAMYPVSIVTHGQALNITCYSYAGTLAFGFAACRDTLPRMQRIAVYTGEALEELEQALHVLPHAPANAATSVTTLPRPGRKRPTASASS